MASRSRVADAYPSGADAYLPIGPTRRDPALSGVVAAGATASAVVVIPLAPALLRRPLLAP